MTYGPTAAERKSLVFRRSLYVAKELKAGDILTTENLRVVRPANGLHPRYYDELLGRAVARDVALGTPVTWEILR